MASLPAQARFRFWVAAHHLRHAKMAPAAPLAFIKIYCFSATKVYQYALYYIWGYDY